MPSTSSIRMLPSRSVRYTATPAARSVRERRRGRVAEGVAGADADRRHPRARPLEQRAEALVGAAVMGDLEHVDGTEVQPVEHRGLGVGGEQDPEPAGPRHGDDRAVVGVASEWHAGDRGLRPQDGQLDAAGAQDLPRLGRRARDAAPRRLGGHARSQRLAHAVAPVEHEADRHRAQHVRRAAVVVGLGVGDDEHVELARRRRAAAGPTTSPSGGPASTSTAASRCWMRVASPWPTSRKVMRRPSGGLAGAPGACTSAIAPKAATSDGDAGGSAGARAEDRHGEHQAHRGDERGRDGDLGAGQPGGDLADPGQVAEQRRRRAP